MNQCRKHGEAIYKFEGLVCPKCASDRILQINERLGNVLPAREQQIEGDHYKKLPIQPFDYSMQNGLDPLQHTIIKYVTRFRDKGGIADLRKAAHCVQLLIEFEEGKANV